MRLQLIKKQKQTEEELNELKNKGQKKKPKVEIITDNFDWVFKKKLKELQFTGDKFTDPEFPPTQESLISDWTDKSHEIRMIIPEWKEYKWLRADQIQSLQPEGLNTLKIFEGIIDYSHGGSRNSWP